MSGKYIPRKTWFLTYSQVPESTKEELLAKLKEIDVVKEYVVAKEQHQDGGDHYHAYVKFDEGVAPKDVLNFTWKGKTAKAESCRSPKAVMKYCKKDGDYISNIENIETYGDNHAKKLTTFLLEEGVDKAVDEGMIGIRNLKRLRQDVYDYKLHQVDVEPTETCKGVWIYGPTGAGKTTEALKRYPGAFRKPPTKWWDGYEGQEVVLLDDLRKMHAAFIVYYLTQWMDRHAPPGGEVKGGQVPLPFKWFVVTSQWSIEELFDEPRDREAIYRRCAGRIYHYVDGGEVDDTIPARSHDMAPIPEYDVIPDPSEVLRICETYAPPTDKGPFERARDTAEENQRNGGAESASAMSHNGMRAWQ